MTINLENLGKIQKIVLVITCVFFIVGLVLSSQAENKRAHNVDKIDIEILSYEQKTDDRYYYIYFDYKITNRGKATVDYVQIKTTFLDKNGKTIGSMTSTLGASYESEALNIEKGKNVIMETYLKESQTSPYISDLFIELYNHELSDYTVTHTITGVAWSDGTTYSR